MTDITINSANRGNAISPMLYGAFFEDINYGGDGGLYAELIANRSFEYYDRDGARDKRAMCWEAVGGAEFGVENVEPLNEVHQNYAFVKADKGGGIRNNGYGGEGFAVKKGADFELSLYAKAAFPASLAARITDIDGRIYAVADFTAESASWEKTELVLTASDDCKHAYLEIVFREAGEAALEFISLFPCDTFMGRKNGMRRDIAEMIKEMHPAFVRFPGGCIVEGRSFENMYNWKDTVGPVEKRRTNWNRWQHEDYRNMGYDASDYFQSYGIGFFEYFLFCEDIGAKPVPVVNCGMTCQWHEALTVDTDKLEPFIQDVFDLIEFANGTDGGKWSALRAQMGHPEPFGLEYIAIGNEQWGNEYFERYEIFQKRISERYPKIKLITSAGWKNRGWEYDLAYDWMRANKDKAMLWTSIFIRSLSGFWQILTAMTITTEHCLRYL